MSGGTGFLILKDKAKSTSDAVAKKRESGSIEGSTSLGRKMNKSVGNYGHTPHSECSSRQGAIRFRGSEGDFGKKRR